MKKLQKRALVRLLTLAMLVPMLTTAIGPAFAATTSGYIGNMDMSLTKNLIAPAEEAMVNMENGGGIRFATNINLEKYAALKKFCKDRRIKGVSVGTLIAPLDYVLEVGEFSTMALGFLDYKTPYLDIKANSEAFYDGEKVVKEGYDEQFVASIVNIKLENRDRKFVAIGYVQLTLLSGDLYTIYSYDNQDMDLVAKYATSVAEVAEKELQKDTWSEEERAKLEDLATVEPQVLATGSEEVTDFRYTRSQAYFTYVKDGVTFYNRITYNGQNGWRLQSNTKNYNNFKDIGAGQSLAMYMDEGFDDIEMPLTVNQKDGEIIIGAAGTDSSAQIVLDTFALDFCGADNVSLYNVNGMSLASNGEVTLTGKMNATDAVYGGGERYDDANKRGKTISLYIADSYDTKDLKGSYVAIPLFSTSRGGGMFINRYEAMKVTFPEKNEVGNWTVTLKTEVLDCYFYATGRISDVLQAYTDMTGHASLPEEWAQGYIVCRFQPDFTSLGGLTGEGNGVTWYYNATDIPNYGNYTYSALLKANGNNITTLKNGEKLVSWDGSEEYYIYTINGSGYLLQSIQDPSKRYDDVTKLPNYSECYLGSSARETKKLTADAVLPHKKAVGIGSVVYYHYIIEDGTQDYNYNGIYNERYFLRTSTKGGTAGAGVTYIVESLIESGMTPTGVILEGVNWYNMVKDATQWVKLKSFVEYLDSMNIKTLVYSYMGYLTGAAMSDKYKSEYMLSVNVYEYDTETGVIGNKKTTTTAIPKTDKTDNPDTASDGTQNYLDITNPDAVKWYVDVIWDEMMELGIDGVKIDFCESLPNEGYYTNMKVGGSGYLTYNWYDPTIFEGTEVHHAYPSYFVSMFYKAMEEKAAARDGDTGFVVLTRGGGIGAQRNPYLWAGDQTRRFTNLTTQLAAVINSGISGIPFMTYDMAGYAYYGTTYHFYGGQPQTITEANGNYTLKDLRAAEEYESEIFVRALQYTTFGNLIQTHGDVRHIYQMTEEAQEIAALYTSLHEELADYLQILSQIACDTGMPMIRHMILQYQNDQNVADISDQFMYGDGLLVAPILTSNTKNENGKVVLDYASVVTRTVYLPAGEWIDLNTGETIVSTGQTITVRANLAKIPVYLNTASEYAEDLQTIFAGETWSAIKALANPQ